VANLNDAYPWGFWIGFDVLTGVALAAGGFTLTAAVYVWQNKKYYPVIRPAVLTAFLGYAIFVLALMVDLGRYYRIWHVLWPTMWQHNSVMFEVGWCVAVYLMVLFLEFLPVVFERFGWTSLARAYNPVMSVLVILMLTVFTLALAGTWKWAALVAGLMILFELLKVVGVVPRDRTVPMLLVIAGVVLSCLHQSSLGSLYLIIPHKLHPLWWTRLLPLLFLTSAIMAGPAMVILEGTLSARVFRRPMETNVLQGLGAALPVLVGLYLVLRVGDVVARGVVWQAFEPTWQALMFWVEIVVGGLIPITLLATPEVRQRTSGLFTGALCVAVGVLINRLDVSIVGIHAPGWQSYTPALGEIVISLAIVSLGLLAFRYIVLHFPVFVGHSEQPALRMR
jgi:Ni/Fe-hydrogenase subunit HybB-like protein